MLLLYSILLALTHIYPEESSSHCRRTCARWERSKSASLLYPPLTKMSDYTPVEDYTHRRNSMVQKRMLFKGPQQDVWFSITRFLRVKKTESLSKHVPMSCTTNNTSANHERFGIVVISQLLLSIIWTAIPPP